MTLGPVPVPFFRSSSMASRMWSVVKPNASLPFWLPAMDWKIMSAGAPRFTASIWVVMWPRTQIWVGISNWFFTSSKRFNISDRLPCPRTG